MKIITSTALVSLCFGLTGCTLFGAMSVKEPPFEVALKETPFEIRDYDEIVLVETTVADDFDQASSEGFRRLFKYISGENVNSEKIEMTAPVTMELVNQKIEGDLVRFTEKSGDGWTMSFVLPERFTLDNAPMPTNENVRLRRVPGSKVAVAGFSGRWNVDSFNEKADDLLRWLEENEYKAASAPRSAAFNPPWTIPFLRRNEIHIDITR